MASILGSNFVAQCPGIDVVAQATQVFNNGLAVAVSVADGNGDDDNEVDLPFAYLYYLL